MFSVLCWIANLYCNWFGILNTGQYMVSFQTVITQFNLDSLDSWSPAQSRWFWLHRFHITDTQYVLAIYSWIQICDSATLVEICVDMYTFLSYLALLHVTGLLQCASRWGRAKEGVSRTAVETVIASQRRWLVMNVLPAPISMATNDFSRGKNLTQ